jgi:hypothetical protein
LKKRQLRAVEGIKEKGSRGLKKGKKHERG